MVSLTPQKITSAPFPGVQAGVVPTYAAAPSEGFAVESVARVIVHVRNRGGLDTTVRALAAAGSTSGLTSPVEWIWEKGEDGQTVSRQSLKRGPELLSIATRWLQDFGDRGLPSRDPRGRREYLWPDVLTWYSTYKGYEVIGKRTRYPSMAVARAEHERFRARVFGEEPRGPG